MKGNDHCKRRNRRLAGECLQGLLRGLPLARPASLSPRAVLTLDIGNGPMAVSLPVSEWRVVPFPYARRGAGRFGRRRLAALRGSDGRLTAQLARPAWGSGGLRDGAPVPLPYARAASTVVHSMTSVAWLGHDGAGHGSTSSAFPSRTREALTSAARSRGAPAASGRVCGWPHSAGATGARRRSLNAGAGSEGLRTAHQSGFGMGRSTFDPSNGN